MMDPLITNGIDAALLRVLDKRGHDRDPTNRRKPAGASKKPAGERRDEEQADEERLDEERPNEVRQEDELEVDPNAPGHKLDDMA
jgi:hypothetical protein